MSSTSETLDVALLPMREAPARFVARTLFEQEDFVIVRRAGHPIGRKLTLARYCAAPHVMVSVSGDPHGLVDRELAKARLASRRVTLTVSNFMQALAVVAESDLVAAMPRRFAARYAARYRVVIAEPPIPLTNAPVLAIAPQVATMDGGLTWLLGVLERGGKSLVDQTVRRPVESPWLSTCLASMASAMLRNRLLMGTPGVFT